MTMRIRVNPIACDAHALCVELLPELFRLDDWGYPIIDTDLVPTSLESLARMAADSCPTLAIVIEDVNK
jgi:ferredoxin